ncbi:uncharacterized protein EDB93DRAFT_1109336 [Suillus bovinus]|uniref:uncharacterized protein n=1 Tax=Suillus bovinus TaxID=48563 RepID=UPI001B873711|nr:uncharacterized protein EDB93DRAFT_1109336 [Suillus bovinus]KAG2127264.1 hypothetical protein EDB93DRAFT_1109336 [Suillus bovinus]
MIVQVFLPSSLSFFFQSFSFPTLTLRLGSWIFKLGYVGVDVSVGVDGTLELVQCLYIFAFLVFLSFHVSLNRSVGNSNISRITRDTKCHILTGDTGIMECIEHYLHSWFTN